MSFDLRTTPRLITATRRRSTRRRVSRSSARTCGSSTHGPGRGLCRADAASRGVLEPHWAREDPPTAPRLHSGAVALAGEGHDARLPGRLRRSAAAQSPGDSPPGRAPPKPADVSSRAGQVLEDLAIATGATLVAAELGSNLDSLRPSMLGLVRAFASRKGARFLSSPPAIVRRSTSADGIHRCRPQPNCPRCRRPRVHALAVISEIARPSLRFGADRLRRRSSIAARSPAGLTKSARPCAKRRRLARPSIDGRRLSRFEPSSAATSVAPVAMARSSSTWPAREDTSAGFRATTWRPISRRLRRGARRSRPGNRASCPSPARATRPLEAGTVAQVLARPMQLHPLAMPRQPDIGRVPVHVADASTCARSTVTPCALWIVAA